MTLNTRGWFPSDEAHEEFEAMCRSHRYESEAMHKDLRYWAWWVRGFSVLVVINAVGFALSPSWWDLVPGLVAWCLVWAGVWRHKVLTENYIQTVREHSHEREEAMERLIRRHRR